MPNIYKPAANVFRYCKNRKKNLKKQYAFVFQAAQDYQNLCRRLAIDDALHAPVFAQHQAQSATHIRQLQQHHEAAEQQFGVQAGKAHLITQQLYDLQKEIKEIEQRPNSNLPTKQQQWRDEIQAAFNIAPETLIFIGEMLDVAPEHSAWQGAIERALGGLRTTLLVPENQFNTINQWVNQRHMKAHIRIQAVDLKKVQAVEFQQQGYLSKLIWRDHIYQNWLRGFLSKRDLLCVDTMAAFERTPFSMTQQGLQHLERGRSEKKDQQHIDDKQFWYLGFSNKNRLGSLKTELATVQQQQAAQQQTLVQTRAQMNHLAEQKNLWTQLSQIQWVNIDVRHIETQLNEKCQLIQQLNQGDMQQAEQRWHAAKQHTQAMNDALIQAKTHEHSLREQQQRTETELAQHLPLAQQSISEPVRQLLAKRFEKQELNAHNQHRVQQQLEQLCDQAQAQSREIEKKAERIMQGFRNKLEWQPYTLEWATDFQAALPDYIAHLNQLQNEGLPQLAEQQAERLNKHSSQSLMSFEEMFIKIHQDIQFRIQKINDVLARTEFMQAHHYLRLGYKPEHYPHVKEFKQKVVLARQKYTSDDQDLRFNLLQDVISVLKKHIDSQTLESQRLLDPRYQLEFYADVLDKHNENQIIETLSSSSGKSGGEKEAFAGMIVAASLAYVLTPEGHDRPVYCTVFLDEAFSNTAENVSRRVLRVFKELNLHVNLITPYKNLNLARESARSLIIAHRNSDTHESYLSEMTWEEVDNHYESQLLGQAA